MDTFLRHVKTISRSFISQHRFNARESDWGFPNFMSPLADLYDPARSFLVSDRSIIEVDVAVHKPLDYCSHHSKKVIGCVGLKNQGATCYMNSLLQTLYNIPYLRKLGLPGFNSMPSALNMLTKHECASYCNH